MTESTKNSSATITPWNKLYVLSLESDAKVRIILFATKFFANFLLFFFIFPTFPCRIDHKLLLLRIILNIQRHTQILFIVMFQLLSKYRTEMMGIAIIGIFLFHCESFYQQSCRPLWLVMSTGFGGVDLFFFLSGMGLWFSFSKDQDVIKFYRKRLIRIFPTFAIITLIGMWFTHSFKLDHYLLTISTIGFWIDISNNWFLPSLVICYLIFPLLFIAARRWPVGALIITFIISIGLLTLYNYYECTGLTRLAITRLPVFMLGIVIAPLVKTNKRLTITQKWLMIVLFVIAIGFEIYCIINKTFAYHYGMLWYAMFMLALPLLLALGLLLNRIGKIARGILHFHGTLSLEIYLFLLYVVSAADQYARLYHCSVTTFLIASYITILGLSFGIHHLLGFWNKRRKHRP